MNKLAGPSDVLIREGASLRSNRRDDLRKSAAMYGATQALVAIWERVWFEAVAFDTAGRCRVLGERLGWDEVVRGRFAMAGPMLDLLRSCSPGAVDPSDADDACGDRLWDWQTDAEDKNGPCHAEITETAGLFATFAQDLALFIDVNIDLADELAEEILTTGGRVEYARIMQRYHTRLRFGKRSDSSWVNRLLGPNLWVVGFVDLTVTHHRTGQQ